MNISNIHLKKGDITQTNVDALVNAANTSMLGGGGVDGAIHRAAGSALLEACQKVPAREGGRCPIGEGRMTSAGNLAARCVIHTVGPRYGIDEPANILLQRAYHNSFLLAKEHNCRTIALPAVSCGVYGYPIEAAGKIAFDVSKGFASDFENISFYLMPEEIYISWQKIFTTES